MTSGKKTILKIFSIFILTVVAGVFSFSPFLARLHPSLGFLSEVKINLGLDLQGGMRLEYLADLSQIESEKKDEAMQAVQDVIERRVNAFGVAEPSIYTVKSGEENRLVVELAGIRDIDQAKNLIRETPFLDFREEKESDETEGKGGDLGFVSRGAFVPEFDQILFEKNLGEGEIYPELVETQFGWHIIKKIEERTVPAENRETGEEEAKEDSEDVRQIRAAHILFTKQSEENMGEEDNQALREIIADMNEQAKTKAEDILKQVLEGGDFGALANEHSQDPGNQPQPEFVPTGLSGKHLKSAQVVFASQGLSEPQVSLKFDSEGTELFAQITKKNLGKRVAIYLDEEVISAPTVQSEITNGEAVITGTFSISEANDLVRRLNEGALPVPIELIGQQSVEASLGQESLRMSLRAGALGLLFVAVFMIFYYRLFGVLASLLLLLYAGVMVSIFKISAFTPWGVTFTLSGIAGLILSVGMAVDANILIFERIKEEIRKGRSLRGSIAEGYRRAWPSIRDGNFSTIITSIILIGVGAGFVKGFAVVLVIGIFVSMFTAIVVSRTLIEILAGEWLEKRMWLIARNSKERDFSRE